MTIVAILLLILSLMLFVGLVVVHEFGHFLAARRRGVVVEEFGIGFPPQAWSKQLKNGVLFTLNWLPLGGFVKLKGEHDSATAKGSFGAASLGTKVQVLLAGVGMNLLAAFVIFTGLALVGMPRLIDNQFTISSDTKITQNKVLVGAVEAHSPADKAGLKQRDEVMALGPEDHTQTVHSASDLPRLTHEFAGKKVDIQINRNGKEQRLQVQLRTVKEVEASMKSNHPIGYLGVVPAELTLRRSTWTAPIVALGTMKQLTAETFKALGRVVWDVGHGKGKEASQQVSGPIEIVVILKDGSQMGLRFVLMIIALISLTLAIMNVLPIPALDGGRLFVTLLYRKVLRKPLTQETEERIHGVGFMVLIALILLISVIDIQRIRGG